MLEKMRPSGKKGAWSSPSGKSFSILLLVSAFALGLIAIKPEYLTDFVNKVGLGKVVIVCFALLLIGAHRSK